METLIVWLGVTVVVPESVPPKLICFAFSKAFAPFGPNVKTVAVVVPAGTVTERETSGAKLGHESKKFPLPSPQPRKFTFNVPLTLNGFVIVMKTRAESVRSAEPKLKLKSVGLGLTC